MSDHVIEIAEHIAGRNPQHLKPGIAQSAISDLIALRIVPHRMRFAIDFNRQPPFKTREIGNVATARELAPKAKAVRPLSQLLPQDDFRQGELAAKLARETDVCVRRADGAVPDTPSGPSNM